MSIQNLSVVCLSHSIAFFFFGIYVFVGKLFIKLFQLFKKRICLFHNIQNLPDFIRPKLFLSVVC